MEAFLKVEEISKIFEVKPTTVRRWCKTGVLKARKIGKSWYVPKSELTLTEDEKTTNTTG